MTLSALDITSLSPAPFELVEPMVRGHDRRSDDAWLQARLNDPSTEFMPVWQTLNLVTRTPVSAARAHIDEVAALLPQADSIVYLGMHDERAVFALGLPKGESEPLETSGKWMNMRIVGELLDPADWSTMAYARAMVYWHERHRNCGLCGHLTVSIMGGHVRKCTNPECATEHYPRTDPCIIVLVFYGEHCLLGRQQSWPAGRYSTLAGFIEPGESAEQAVAREVYEESGVSLKEARYFGSQSWPFPASLMLGFHAEASTQEIHRHDGELDDARWFTRKELRDALDAGTVGLPTPVAISHRLIAAWFNQEPVGGKL